MRITVLTMRMIVTMMIVMVMLVMKMPMVMTPLVPHLPLLPHLGDELLLVALLEDVLLVEQVTNLREGNSHCWAGQVSTRAARDM